MSIKNEANDLQRDAEAATKRHTLSAEKRCVRASGAPPFFSGFSKIKLFWALSRTTHGLLDMATPFFAALLYLGHFPTLGVILLGLVTAFAGYTAVYALNDVVDYRADKAKVQKGALYAKACDVDAVFVRHPMAQGYLSFRAGLFWTLAWGIVALFGAYILNPVCVFIFVAGCLVEAIYCLALRVSHWRVLLAGGVKTSGGMAAILAVDPAPSPYFLVALFFMLFCWEIGGQNIPNDWTDREEDRHNLARTIPLQMGPDRVDRIIKGSLLLAVVFSVFAMNLACAPLSLFFQLLIVAVGVVFLIRPALRLSKARSEAAAMNLFNQASYYPVALLSVVFVAILMR